MKLANRITVPDETIIAIAATVSALLIIFLLCFNCGADVPCYAPGVITVSEIKENYKIGDLEVKISRPVVTGFSDKYFENQLNLKIQNQISLNRQIAEMKTEQWFDSEHEISYSLYSDYCVKSSAGILSLKVTTIFWYYNCGGMPLSSYYNADIANNKLLALGDLFTDDSYKQRLNKYITETMVAQEYPSPDLFEGVSDKTKYFIMDRSLYITFSKYEISSGSEGEPEFLIPTEEIEDLLKEEYKEIFK